MKNEMTPRGWLRKFGLAFSGLFWAFCNEGSFSVQLPAAALAISLGVLLQIDTGRWAMLLLTISFVISLELINTALESLARAIDQEENNHIKIGLDVASGAVLFSSLMAVLMGLIIFWSPFWRWWTIQFPG
ncbi:diacylglycerol kinase [bacterium]|nr:diacylglycerol kinase [bacterium]